MRRITLWLFSTVAAMVLLFSYRTSTGGATPAAPQAQAQEGAGAGKTYAGSTAQTRWGPVQVTITVDGGKITGVAVPTYPNENRRDQEINARALPTLRQETLDKQSADIDAVSGATVTSDGYKESLQAALDAAHLN
ncbi:FMN-binding protein [Actinoplanes sp. CA-142083]|uniref:FMN-binding protein n=1 Tax=Actinoplanes sp. CA-142083 TaxID=3239903 RepID=UPI003D92DE17